VEGTFYRIVIHNQYI